VSSDSIVKGIIDDIIKTAVKTAKVDEQKAKYLQHLQQSCQIKQRYTFHLHPAFIEVALLFMSLLIFNEQRVPKRVSMIRVYVGPISETVYIDIILNTIIER
jgi:hypothetical protein